jgi:hypothetical protein
VTKVEMIQRLEQLLKRVRLRAAEPRTVARLDTPRIAAAAPAALKANAEVEVAPIAPRVMTPQVPVLGLGGEHESQERLVAAQSEPPEEPTVVVIAAPARESTPPIDVTEVEVVEEEEEEEAPISSRRTVAHQPEERLAEMAFGGEEPRAPLHTPPPESGRLPAAPPVDFDQDITGVRSATPGSPHRGPEVRPELVPEVVRAEAPPSDTVAEMIADAQRFAPATFLALLDASLAL